MIATLLLAPPAIPSRIAAKDLALRVEAPRAATVGQAFTVRVWLVNGRATPVTIVDPAPLTTLLGTRFADTLSRSGVPVAAESETRATIGRWGGQWVNSSRFGAESFRTLEPGARLAIEERTFGREYVSGEPPEMGRRAPAPMRPLGEGAYVYRAAWTFRPLPKEQIDRWAELGIPLELTPEAQALQAKSWVGTLAVEHRIRIAKP